MIWGNTSGTREAPRNHLPPKPFCHPVKCWMGDSGTVYLFWSFPSLNVPGPSLPIQKQPRPVKKSKVGGHHLNGPAVHQARGIWFAELEMEQKGFVAKEAITFPEPGFSITEFTWFLDIAIILFISRHYTLLWRKGSSTLGTQSVISISELSSEIHEPKLFMRNF